jgi:hypothetical protein
MLLGELVQAGCTRRSRFWEPPCMAEEDPLPAIVDVLRAESDKWIHDGVGSMYLATKGDADGVILEGNRGGLIRLAMHALGLANRPSGSHQHFDSASELDVAEVSLVLARVTTWEDERRGVE